MTPAPPNVFRPWLGVLLSAALVFAHLPVGVARAQGDAQNTALARDLFEEGVALADEARWEEAVDRFRRALALRDAPAIRFNLGHSLSRLGRLVEASEMLRTVEGHTESDDAVRGEAAELRRDVERRFAHLTIRVDGETAGVRVRLDDRELPDAALGVAAPVDPGTHRAVAMRDGVVVAEEQVSLAEAEQRETVLRLGPVPPTGDAPADPRLEGDEEAEGSVLGAWWFWTGVGVVVVGAVVLGLVLAGSGGRDPTRGDLEIVFE